MPCVVPFEKSVSPSLPACTRVTGLVAAALDNPEIVIAELFKAAKSASATRVTVIKFSPPARGLVCPTAFVVKLAALTVEQKKLIESRRNVTKMAKECLRAGRLNGFIKRKRDAVPCSEAPCSHRVCIVLPGLNCCFRKSCQRKVRNTEHGADETPTSRCGLFQKEAREA